MICADINGIVPLETKYTQQDFIFRTSRFTMPTYLNSNHQDNDHQHV